MNYYITITLNSHVISNVMITKDEAEFQERYLKESSTYKFLADNSNNEMSIFQDKKSGALIRILAVEE